MLLRPVETFIAMSKDQEDAHLIQRVEPNSKIGLVMSVRAFEMEVAG